MIRDLPLDTTRFILISTGHCTPVPEWVELTDGSRRPSGNQAREKRENGTLGAPLWVLDAMVDQLVPDEDQDRAEVIGIQVASGDKPTVKRFQPLHLEGLMVRVSAGRDGKLRQYWSADGVVPAPSGNGRPPALAGAGKAEGQ